MRYLRIRHFWDPKCRIRRDLHEVSSNPPFLSESSRAEGASHSDHIKSNSITYRGVTNVYFAVVKKNVVSPRFFRILHFSVFFFCVFFQKFKIAQNVRIDEITARSAQIRYIFCQKNLKLRNGCKFIENSQIKFIRFNKFASLIRCAQIPRDTFYPILPVIVTSENLQKHQQIQFPPFGTNFFNAPIFS